MLNEVILLNHMLQSKLFPRSFPKEAPQGEGCVSAQLLLRAGFIEKLGAGIYTMLPLGLRVLNNVAAIIRSEMATVDAQELFMPAMHPKEAWERTGRWETAKEVMYQFKDNHGHAWGLGFTHEEIITDIVAHHVASYRDVPLYLYQIQTKFRNEPRATSGLLRGREFMMKDMYSFHATEEDFEEFYNKMKDVYKTIFQRVGIGHLTYLTFASGGTFSKYSHEFQTITAMGEDTIYVDEEKGVAVNKEVLNSEVLKQLNLTKEKLAERKAIEVGNIFDLKTKYSKPFDLSFTDEKEQKHAILMGCYGIGLGRLMGTVVEVLSDDKGIIWPESIAPFQVHLLALGDDKEILGEAEKVYKSLLKAGVEVLFDDRAEVLAGEKFADADLLGIPFRVVVSARSMKESGVEIKKRTEEKGKVISLAELLKQIEP